MDTFLDHADKFVWIFDMPLGASVYQIRVPITRDATAEEDSGKKSGGGGSVDDSGGPATQKRHPWRDMSEEIQSVLSLWLFGIKNDREGSYGGDDRWGDAEKYMALIQKKARYVLGPDTNRSLRWDVGWWVSKDIVLDERQETCGQETKMAHRETVIGYRGSREQGKGSRK